jgi:hypothetical protein
MGIESSVVVLMARVDVAVDADDDIMDGLAGEGDRISRFDDFLGDRKRPRPFFLPGGDDMLFSVDEEEAPRETPSREDSTDKDEDAPMIVAVLVVVADTLATALVCCCCCFNFKSRLQNSSWDSDCVGAKYS